MRRILTALMALLTVSTAHVAQAQTRIGLEIGSRPGPLALEALDGGTVDLGEVIGRKPVLLQFWATWCPDCRELHPEMVAAHAEFGDQVEFFGIAVAVGQNPRRVRRHLEDHPMPYPILWDARGAAVRRFMAPVTSYIVILDSTGRVAYTGVNTEQDIRGALRRIAGEGQSASDS